MKLTSILVKSGLAVAGAGMSMFFRRLVKKAKKTEEKIEDKIKAKKKTVARKSAAKPRQRKARVAKAHPFS
jgi:Na+-transporting methylmalonyl-CoA/oxaloacetate decarboxylase gamma subunit